MADAWSLVMVVVSPANAVVEVVPNPGKVTLAVFAVIALACAVVIPVLALLVVTFPLMVSKSVAAVTVRCPTLVESADG